MFLGSKFPWLTLVQIQFVNSMNVAGLFFLLLTVTVFSNLNKNLSFAEANFGTLAECFGVGVHPRGLAQHSDMIRI